MTDTLTATRRGRILHVVLDRPKALNSLDLDMCLAFHQALDRAHSDPDIDAIVTTSASPKAFSAGGDIKAVRQNKIDGDDDRATEFFAREYEMNLALARSTTPVVSLIHGAAMGGGLGVSIHGSHRVVSPSVMMAMPETAIGFIPDVGASYFLPRLAGGGQRGLAVGLYLGMTGARMDAADTLYTAMATHLMDHERHEQFVDTAADRGIEAALDECVQPPADAGDSTISAHIDRIEKVFSAGDAAAIMSAARADATDSWGQDTLDLLHSHSPTSLVATVELLRAGASDDVAQCLRNEFHLGGWMLDQPDFVEGVRAVLVDKDRNPAWSNSSVDDVDLAPIRQALARAR